MRPRYAKADPLHGAAAGGYGKAFSREVRLDGTAPKLVYAAWWEQFVDSPPCSLCQRLRI
jgi:hypothetical protein